MYKDYEMKEKYMEVGSLFFQSSFGTCFKAVDKRDKKELVLYRKSDAFMEQSAQPNREIDIHIALKHPFVIKFLGFIPKTDSTQHTLVFDCPADKSLGYIIKQFNSHHTPDWFDGTARTKIAFDIAVGMSYIHSKNVVHRDLKVDNILIDRDCNPVIIDFSCSKFLDQNDQNTSQIGSPVYMAPEIFDDSSSYDYKVDVYSYSLILYQLLTSNIPFEGVRTAYQLFSKVTRGERPSIPNDLINLPITQLMKACWNGNHEERPSFEQMIDMFKTNADLVFPNCDIHEFELHKEQVLR